MAQTDPAPYQPDAFPTVPDRTDRTNFPTQMYNFFVQMAKNVAGGFYYALTNLATITYNNAVDAYNNAVTAGSSATSAQAAQTAAETAASQATGAANVNGTSATNITPAFGVAKTFTYVEANKANYVKVGMRVAAISRANPSTNYHRGWVSATNGNAAAGAGTIEITADCAVPAAAAAVDWNIVLEGAPGEDAGIVAQRNFAVNGTLTVLDDRAHVVATASGVTLSTDPVASLGNGWSVFLPAQTYKVTIAPSANFTDATSSKTVSEGEAAILHCDGTNFRLTRFGGGDNEITLNTGNGYGSTNTQIRRYTTAQRSAGSAMTYADSATLGASITINESGLYEIYMQDYDAASTAAVFGFSVNTTTPTTTIQTIAASERGGMEISSSNGTPGSLCRTLLLSVGDVVRPHNGTLCSRTTALVLFSIRKVGAK